MGLILEMGLILVLLGRVFQQNKVSVFELMGLILKMSLILERSYMRDYTVHVIIKLAKGSLENIYILSICSKVNIRANKLIQRYD